MKLKTLLGLLIIAACIIARTDLQGMGKAGTVIAIITVITMIIATTINLKITKEEWEKRNTRQ